MANAQYDVGTKSANRMWVKIGLASFSFIAAVVGAFDLAATPNLSGGPK
jgi:hypothetical protein